MWPGDRQHLLYRRSVSEVANESRNLGNGLFRRDRSTSLGMTE
jgi:hypothetical protein